MVVANALIDLTLEDDDEVEVVEREDAFPSIRGADDGEVEVVEREDAPGEDDDEVEVVEREDAFLSIPGEDDDEVEVVEREDALSSIPMAKRAKLSSSSSPPLAWRVLRTLGIAPEGNSSSYCVGFREGVAADRPADFVVIGQFVIDSRWLVNIWPELVSVPRVIVFCTDCCKAQRWPSNFEVHEREPMDCFEWQSSSNFNPYHWGSLHAKFTIVGFEDSGLRVVISSANLASGDVDDMTNGVWWQDFPRGRDESSEFGKTLRDFVDSVVAGRGSATGGEWGATGLSGSLSEVLRNYDFRGATATLIPTVPGVHKGDAKYGAHKGDAMWKYGHMCVRRLLALEKKKKTKKTKKNEGSSSTEGSLSLIAQFSSVAYTDAPFISNIKRSFGDVDELQIVWPTAQEVRAARGGSAGGVALPTATERVRNIIKYLHTWFSMKDDHLSPFVAARTQVFAHLKCFTGWFHESGADDRIEWSIMGSHNFSRAAWGHLQRDTQFFCASWELSVLVTPQSLGVDALVTAEQYERFSPQRKATANVGIVPLPFSTPPVAYSDEDNPWVEESEVISDDQSPVDAFFGATGFSSAMLRHHRLVDYCERSAARGEDDDECLPS